MEHGSQNTELPALISRLPQLVGDKYWRRIEDLAIAQSEDEIFLQVISLLALGRTHTVKRLISEYVKRGCLTKEKLCILGMIFIESHPLIAIDCLSRLRGKFQEKVFSIKEILWLVEKGEVHLSTHDKWEIYKWCDPRKDFPQETLASWGKDVLSGASSKEDGKWGSMLVIELYNSGGKEFITPEAVASYFKWHSLAFPDCHGNHRMLSLLGFGASDSGWDLYREKDNIAEGLFHLIMNEVKSMHYVVNRKESIPNMTIILLEIIESFEDKKFVKEVIVKLIEMLSNCRNNSSSLLRNMRRRYSL
jgi:hypothetical protein